MTEQTFGIIGGGIVGLAVGREIGRRHPGTRVVVFEAEDRVAAHQTGHNSGVVHAGIYYKPGSLKAELCTRGRKLIQDYCAEQQLPFDECGKLVVAVDRDEMAGSTRSSRPPPERVPGLSGSKARGIRRSSRTRRRRCPALAAHRDHRLRRDRPRDRGRDRGGGRPGAALDHRHRCRSPPRADRRGRRRRAAHRRPAGRLWRPAVRPLGELVGGLCATDRAVPRRVHDVAATKQDLVRGMIYPVPDPRYPFLGVHFTRRVSGGLEVGPNALLALRRQGYGRRPSRRGRPRQHPGVAGLLALRAGALAHGLDRDPRRRFQARLHEVGPALRARHRSR